MLKPVKVSENRTVKIKDVTCQSVVECRFPQTSEICEIIVSDSQVSLVSCEAASGRVNYSGKLILTIVYSDEEGKLCRMQKGAEFSHFVDDNAFAPKQTCLCKLSVERLTTKRDGSSYVIAAVVSADISVYAQGERTYIKSAEGAFVNTGKVTLCSPVTFSGQSELEDDFSADSVEDVLIPGAGVIVLSAVCSVGEVAIEGELYLSLLAMRGQAPVCLERVIPFKCAVPCDDATPGRSAFVNAEISELTVSAGVNEDRGKCDINVNCTLSFCGWFTDEHSEDVALDAFSTGNVLQIESQDESFCSIGESKVYTERVKGIAVTKDRLGYDCAFLAAVLPKAECEYNYVTGCAEGSVNFVLIYSRGGEVKSTEVNLPISVALSAAVEEGESVSINAVAGSVAVRLRAEGEAEAEANVKICAVTEGCSRQVYISSIAEGEAIDAERSALSVFIPQKGDTLWNVSKKLGQSPAEVAECNPELNYPLSGSERIIVYRQKK